MDNTDQMEGSNAGSEFGSLSGAAKNGGLLGAIKDANGTKDRSFKEIDDEFEVEPDVNKKSGFANQRDNLRQGVSSGFNFKDILNNDAPCSEDGMSELNSGRQDNPMDDE